MYDSPITVLIHDIRDQLMKSVEDAVYEQIQTIEVKVDKEELLKALRYDRDQYETGFSEGFSAGYNAALADLSPDLIEQ